MWLLLPRGRFAFCSPLGSPGEPLRTPRASRASRPQPCSCDSREDGRTASSHWRRVAFEPLPRDWWESESTRVSPGLPHACVLGRFSRVRLCANPQTAAHQAPLSMGFSRQEYWGGLHALLQGIFPTQGWNQRLLSLPHSQAGFLPLTHWEALHESQQTPKLEPREVETDGAPRAAAVRRPRVQPAGSVPRCRPGRVTRGLGKLGSPASTPSVATGQMGSLGVN